MRKESGRFGGSGADRGSEPSIAIILVLQVLPGTGHLKFAFQAGALGLSQIVQACSFERDCDLCADSRQLYRFAHANGVLTSQAE